MIRPEIDIRKPDPAVCMVRDCDRKALYRSAATQGRNKGGRGYCSKHKAYATMHPPSMEKAWLNIARRLSEL